MSVNPSTRQFYDDHLLSDVRSILSQTGMDAAFLDLEITESLLMRDVKKANKVLVEFKKLGIRLSPDGGTGYSSQSTSNGFRSTRSRSTARSFVSCPANREDMAITDAGRGRFVGNKVQNPLDSTHPRAFAAATNPSLEQQCHKKAVQQVRPTPDH